MTNVTVLSANLWLLPPPASADNPKRLSTFADLAIKLNPDVINLQEVWLNKYKKYLKTRLSQYHLVSPRSLIYNRSGLLTFLKLKPDSSKFIPFKKGDASPVEKVASKGLLISRFTIKGKTFTNINTHLHDTREKSKLKVALAQAERAFKEAKKHNPTIITGDFNLESSILTNFLADFKQSDSLSDTYSPKNEYAHKGAEFFRNKKGVHIKRPDYVFINVKSTKATINSEVITTPLVSDHYPIISEISLPESLVKTNVKRAGHVLKTPGRLMKKVLLRK